MKSREMFDHLENQVQFMKDSMRQNHTDTKQEGVYSILGVVQEILSTVKHAKNEQALAGIAHGLNIVLEKEFFSQVRSLTGVQKEAVTEPRTAEPKQEKKEKPASAGVQGGQEIEVHVIDASELPPEVQKKLLSELNGMGIGSKEDIIKFFRSL